MRIIIIAISVVAACTSQHQVVDRVACNSCHTDEFDSAPIHATNNFTRACNECHGTTAWRPAEQNHGRYFDIASSSHTGWDCADCHVAIPYPNPPAAGSAINCIGCHAHDQARTDPYHVGKGDYTWAPSSCLQCHGGG